MKIPGTMIGVDLGGTNVRAGLIVNGKLANVASRPIHSQGSKEEVLSDLYATIDAAVEKKAIKSIGVGVPSLVRHLSGTILNTTNIPSWTKVPLRRLLEKKYKVPVRIDNDANCFALGEYYFGAGTENFVGLILGTGLGAGIIANGRLISGTDGGAGEFGLIPYRDSIVEHYASGQFFRKFGREGGSLTAAAEKGEPEALRIFAEYGAHLAFAVKVILYALAPERIVLGGSVSAAYKYFKGPLESALFPFAYPSVLKAVDFKISKIKHVAILGAGTLFLNSKRVNRSDR